MVAPQIAAHVALGVDVAVQLERCLALRWTHASPTLTIAGGFVSPPGSRQLATH
jgi:hypothetical protein